MFCPSSSYPPKQNKNSKSLVTDDDLLKLCEFPVGPLPAPSVQVGVKDVRGTEEAARNVHLIAHTLHESLYDICIASL